MFQKFLENIKLLRLMPRRSLLETLLWQIGLKPSAEIRVGDNVLKLSTKISLNKVIWYLKILGRAHRAGIHVIINHELIKLEYKKDKNKIVLKYPSHDPRAVGIITETLIDQQYDFLNVRDRVVVDVGAYIGDSAIYFAKRGARKVICFEPHPLLFRYLVENVELNGYDDIIECRNYAVSSSEGVVNLTIPENILAFGRASINRSDTYSLKVKAVKLPLEGDVLKMDCEGCEYEVLLNIEPRDLPFQEIGLEYHGSPKPLIKHLKRGGYAVKIVKGGTRLGLLHACRES